MFRFVFVLLNVYSENFFQQTTTVICRNRRRCVAKNICVKPNKGCSQNTRLRVGNLVGNPDWKLARRLRKQNLQSILETSVP